ncbi:MAG: dihydroorotate dehydrogenase [Euryarchaeota archaeon]|nr:dihydroorotate dehydrogenase [Euryarchaeota archaeon]
MNIFGCDFPNPVLLASGVLGISRELFLRLEKLRIGGIVTKSIGLTPRKGYESPTVVELEYGVINAMGLPNPGVDKFIEEIEDLNLKIPLIVSIFGKNSEEFVKIAQKLEPYVNAIELNFSCPHAEKYGMAIGQDKESVYAITKHVKEAVDTPILAKLTPNVNDIVPIAKAVERGGADGITAINTLKALAVSIEMERPILKNVYGGLSGRSIKPIALRSVYDIYKNVSIPVIGVGGISSAKDALEFMFCGASLVEVGTAARDLTVFKEIADGIEKFLKKKNYTAETIIGRATKNI